MSKYGVHYVFPEDQELAPAAVALFLDQVLSGGIKPTIVSEPIPDSSDLSLPVVTVVGQNFETVAQKANVNTFVMVGWFLAKVSVLRRLVSSLQSTEPHLGEPWRSLLCRPAGPCRQGQHDAQRFSLVGPRLTRRQLGITNFPTLYLFPASGAKPVEFLAKERPLEQLIAFVEKHRDQPKKEDL